MKKMKNKGYAAGGKLPMVKGPDGKMVPEFAADGKGKMAKGGTIKKMKKGMKVKGYAAGGLKDVPEGNKGLGKLPQKARNNMGFKAKGGTIKKMKKGMKVKGYAAGGKIPTEAEIAAAKRGNAASKRLAAEGTTNKMESSAPMTSVRPKKKPSAPMTSMRPKKRPDMMSKGGTIRKMKGGKMVTKGGTKGGAKGGKAKVRGAGIAQRGVRPAKMR